jgi:hypothetical protein
MSGRLFFVFLFFLTVFSLFAQGTESGSHQYVIRGEVYVDLEPIYAGHVDSEYPLDIPAAGRRALEEAALFFSAMVYGWSFSYVPGERARQLAETLELEPVGEIQFGDPALRVTDTEIRGMQFRMWADYHLNNAQQRRMLMWRSGTFRNAQAIGYGPAFIEEYPGWIALKKIALEDAARSALRTMLRGSERNRPREVTGFISLASFPRYFIDGGRWAVSARFRVQVMEIIPFAAH